MNLDLVAQIAVAALGVLSAAVPFLGGRQDRRILKEDIELLNKVPDGVIRQRLERQVIATLDEIEAARHHRRDPYGVTLALVLIAASVIGGVWAISAGGWWLLSLVVVAFVFAVGAAGLVQDVTKRKRDKRGDPID
ncbi:hypothetical protein ACIBF5_04010 [Micromonospora sp. NPDC050417]|uniref:hypothetical protein n=1 Tax=Micromonospora sp. NPDC050417 TaxID=3364280 RepID=UPI00379BA4CF